MTWGSLAPREAVEMHWRIVMAGAYGSHGETYFGTPSGSFVVEAPERLAFLKKIMMQTRFQKLEPLSQVMSGEDPSVTVIGAPGVCYFFHFDQPKETASWNLGFLGQRHHRVIFRQQTVPSIRIPGANVHPSSRLPMESTESR